MNGEFWGSDTNAVSDAYTTPSLSNTNVLAGGGQSIMNPTLTPATPSVLQPNGPIYNTNLLQQSPQQLYHPQQYQQPDQTAAPQQQDIYQSNSFANSVGSGVGAGGGGGAGGAGVGVAASALQQQQQRAASYQQAAGANPQQAAYSLMSPTSRTGIGMRARDIGQNGVIQVETGPLHQNPLDANRSAPALQQVATNDAAQATAEGVYVPVGQRPIEVGDFEQLKQQQQEQQQQQQQDKEDAALILAEENAKRKRANAILQQQHQQQELPLIESPNDNKAEKSCGCSGGNGSFPWTILIIGALVLVLIAAVVTALIMQRRENDKNNKQLAELAAANTTVANAGGASNQKSTTMSTSQKRLKSKSALTKSTSIKGRSGEEETVSNLLTAPKFSNRIIANDDTSSQ